MEIDHDRIDDVVLALLYLNRFTTHKDDGWRAWKGLDWESLDRLHKKAYMSDPVSKAKSVAFSDEGFALAEQRFEALFALQDD